MAIVAANFKMHKTAREAASWAQDVAASPHLLQHEVIVFAGYTQLHAVSEALTGQPLRVGAQDVFWEDFGAYTGMVSPGQLIDAGCSHVLVAHSERRRYAHETDRDAARKLRAALRAGLTPVYCVGDVEEPTEGPMSAQTLTAQLRHGLSEVGLDDLRQVVIAYEPVWAIGTGKAATPRQAREAASAIRAAAAKMFGESSAGELHVLYGGSVTEDNVAAFVREDGVDGLLVGGASLEAQEFLRLLAAVAAG